MVPKEVQSCRLDGKIAWDGGTGFVNLEEMVLFLLIELQALV